MTYTKCVLLWHPRFDCERNALARYTHLGIHGEWETILRCIFHKGNLVLRSYNAESHHGEIPFYYHFLFFFGRIVENADRVGCTSSEEDSHKLKQVKNTVKEKLDKLVEKNANY